MLLAILLLIGQSCQWDFQASYSRVDAMRSADGGSILTAGPGGVFRFDPADGSFGEFYSYPDQLPAVGANDVLEDADGNTWVAPPEEGLAGLIDGEWQLFTVYEGIPGSGVIHCLHEADGRVWAGTDAGMAMQSGEGFVGLDASSTGGGLPTTDVLDLDDDGQYLWVATGNGVYRLDLSASPYSSGSWDSPGETADLSISSLCVSETGQVAAVGGTGLFLKGPEDRWRLIREDTLSSCAWTSWGLLASGNGVWRLRSDSSWSEMGTDFPEGLPGRYYSGPLLEHQDVLWCGIGPITYPGKAWGLGLGNLDGLEDQWEVVTVPGIPASNVNQVDVTQGLTVLGSRFSGLLVGHEEGWRRYGIDNGIPRNLQTYAAVRGSGDDVWCASYSYGLTWIGGGATYATDDDTTVTFTPDSIESPPGLSQVIAPLLNGQVTMLAMSDSVLWVAQEAYWATPDEPSGLMAISGSPPDPDEMVFTGYQPGSSGMAAKNVSHICPAEGGRIWVSYSEDAGCQLLDYGGTPHNAFDDQWSPDGRGFGLEDGLGSGTVTCVEVAPDGTVYAGTPLGVYVYGGSGTWSKLQGADGSVTAMACDAAGRLWANGSQGLIMADEGNVSVFDGNNSPYLPTTREAYEDFATVGPDGYTVYLTSIDGLWSVSLSGGGGSTSGGPVFYPQPWLVGEELLGVTGIAADRQVEVSVHGLDGRHICTVSADSPSEWSWDGTAGGSELASGVYMAVVRHGDNVTSLVKLAVVR